MEMNSSLNCSRTNRAGTSLMEVLVAIVVLLVGILAIAQVFPGGFQIMNLNRNALMATSAGQGLQQFYSAHPEAVPDAIQPIQYSFSGGVWQMSPSATRPPRSLDLVGDSLANNGNLSLGGTVLGKWDYFSGANNLRRVSGDTYAIPESQSVGAGLYGALIVLRYGPVFTATNTYITAQTFAPALDITSSDLELREGAPIVGTNALFQANLSNEGDSTANLWLPVDTSDAYYRVKFAYYVKDAANVVTRRENTYDMAVVPAGTLGTFVSIPLQAFFITNGGMVAGESLQTVELEGVHIQRRFIAQAGAFTAGNPYEYKVVGNAGLGQILLNPAGSNKFEERASGRTRLIAKVTYDVMDWRVLKDDVQLPDVFPYQIRVNNTIKVQGGVTPDRTPYPGLNFDLPAYSLATGTVSNENRSTAVVDLTTGDVIAPVSYTIQGRDNIIEFVDSDTGTAGLQVWAIRPDGTAHQYGPAGHTLRVYYRTQSEWAAQPIKAAATYNKGINPPGPGQYFFDSTVSATRVYFPQSDIGQRVSVQEMWYASDDGTLHNLSAADFVLRKDSADTVGYPFIDVTDVINATDAAHHPNHFDFTKYGYAVRGVKGVSLTVRIIQNPGTFGLQGPTAQENLRAFTNWKDKFATTWLEGYVQQAAVN